MTGPAAEGPTAAPPAAIGYLVVVGACLALGGLSALESRHVSVTHGFPLAWPLVFTSTMPRWLLLATVLPFVLHLATRTPPVPLRPRIVALHLVILLGLSLSHASVDAWSTGHAAPDIVWAFSWTARVARSWYNTMPTVASMYAAVLGAAWGITETRERQRRSLRASQLEAQLQTARLAALRAQLQPHFLANTLTGIAALVADVQPAQAVAAIEHLSELLHASLRDDGRTAVPVAEEVALADRYLALQQMRFGDRLRSEFRVAPAAAPCLVPVLLLQPIVENAVVHGLDAGVACLHVQIEAMVTAAGLVITVEDDGPGGVDRSRRTAGHGVGLAATRARLLTAYGDAASLTLTPRPGGGAIVRIVIPGVAVEPPFRDPPVALAGAR